MPPGQRGGKDDSGLSICHSSRLLLDKATGESGDKGTLELGACSKHLLVTRYSARTFRDGSRGPECAQSIVAVEQLLGRSQRQTLAKSAPELDSEAGLRGLRSSCCS